MDKQERLADIAGRHGVRLLVAFGSRVTGKTHPQSDLDLALLLRDAAVAEDSLSLWAALQDVFAGANIDVVWLHRADPLLAWQILRSGALLFGDAQDFLRHRAYAWRRFVEYGPYFDREAEAVRRAIRRLRRAG